MSPPPRRAGAVVPETPPEGVISSCTVELDGTTWLFDPCLTPGEPLPEDVVQALEEVRQERTGPPPCPSATPTTAPPATTTRTLAETTVPDTTVPGTTIPVPPVDTATGTATPCPSPTDGPLPTTFPPPLPTTPPPLPTDPVPTETVPPDPIPTGPTTTGPLPTGPLPTGPTTTGPVPTSPVPTSPLPTSPTTTNPTPAPTCAAATAATAARAAAAPAPDPAEQRRLTDADRDRLGSRDGAGVPCDERVVLTATGDSVTSAHFQWGFGNMCQRTAFDNRGLTGNHGWFSYAGRYFNLDPKIVRYFNFARTGFGTGDMIGAVPGTLDECGNRWARGTDPVGLSAAAIRQAKRDGYRAYHVSTGGVNDTNWGRVIEGYEQCRALEWAQANLFPAGRTRFWWAAVGGRAGIIPNGGGCVLQVFSPFFWRPDHFFRIGVPGYNGAARAAAITANVRAATGTLLGAGADKLVWMSYYDITLANVDLANFAWTWIRGNVVPGWVVGYLPPRVAPLLVALVDPAHVAAVRALIGRLNAAVRAGLPAGNAKVVMAAPAVAVAADIQTTAIGGAPHPSAAGQTKMANALSAAYAAIP